MITVDNLGWFESRGSHRKVLQSIRVEAVSLPQFGVEALSLSLSRSLSLAREWESVAHPHRQQGTRATFPRQEG